MVFKIKGHFLCKGDGTTIYDHDLYVIRCYLTQKTRCTWIRGEDVNIFKISVYVLLKGDKTICMSSDSPWHKDKTVIR
jgi:hypothetical protein